MTKRFKLLALLATAVIGIGHVAAQPAIVITAVVPFPAGGTLDVLARLITQRVSEQSQETFVIDNRAGANGSIGAKMASKAKPDGRTWLFADGAPVTINPFLYKPDKDFSADKDLRPIRALAFQPLVLVVKRDFAAKTAKDLIERARRQEITYGSGGLGSTGHLAMAYFGSTVGGMKLTHVPYRGGPQLAAALVSGEVDAGFVVVPNVLPYIKKGDLLALAVSSPSRTPLLPDVPTANELGYRGFEVENRYFAWLPAGTPEDVVRKMDAQLKAVLADPDVLERMRTSGLDPLTSMGEADARKWLTANRAVWQKVIREHDIKPD